MGQSTKEEQKQKPHKVAKQAQLAVCLANIYIYTFLTQVKNLYKGDHAYDGLF